MQHHNDHCIKSQVFCVLYEPCPFDIQKSRTYQLDTHFKELTVIQKILSKAAVLNYFILTLAIDTILLKWHKLKVKLFSELCATFHVELLSKFQVYPWKCNWITSMPGHLKEMYVEKRYSLSSHLKGAERKEYSSIVLKTQTLCIQKSRSVFFGIWVSAWISWYTSHPLTLSAIIIEEPPWTPRTGSCVWTERKSRIWAMASWSVPSANTMPWRRVRDRSSHTLENRENKLSCQKGLCLW